MFLPIETVAIATHSRAHARVRAQQSGVRLLKHHLTTIDAMGCQFEIGDLILKKEGHYIFSLKGNQGHFFDDIQLFLNDSKQIAKLEMYEDYDKGHGRIETRTCWVSDDVSWLQEAHPRWKSIKSIIRIDSVRDIKGKISTETRFYISSMIATAQKFLSAIRSHWAIENNLHWVLDENQKRKCASSYGCC